MSMTRAAAGPHCGLTQGQEPIAQVAHDCGFPTLSNFGEQFRRRFGVAPRSFRQAARRR